MTAKKKRGQQPGRPAPGRRDYSHLPPRQTEIDLPMEANVCTRYGKPLADLGLGDASEQLEVETTVYRQVVRWRRYRASHNYETTCSDMRKTHE